MKQITISLSHECVLNCPFCYTRKKSSEFMLWDVLSSIREYAKKDTTLCFEYSGYNIRVLAMGELRWKKTITTMPCLATETFVGFCKAHGISSMALSFNECMGSAEEWLEAGKRVKDAGIHLACNWLLGGPSPTLDIIQCADQLNVLSRKPDGRVSEEVLDMIRGLCIFHRCFNPGTEIAVDNCLGVQLGFIDSCQRGKETIHIGPDGTVSDCSFGSDCYLHGEAQKDIT